METLRSFIALELSPQIQDTLGQIQDQLKKAKADVKWVKPEGIHLTLKFLGSVSLKLLDEIKPCLDNLVQEHQCFQLQIGKIGAFPKVEFPRVIWVEIEQGAEQTIQLAQDLEQRLLNFGFLKEKRTFKPHLTLGRVRSSHNREQLKQSLTSLTFPPTSMQAETLILFKSTLTPQGAIYQPLHQVKLS